MIGLKSCEQRTTGRAASTKIIKPRQAPEPSAIPQPEHCSSMVHLADVTSQLVADAGRIRSQKLTRDKGTDNGVVLKQRNTWKHMDESVTSRGKVKHIF